ncbi:hypothetical protein EG68_12605 [Paragonimus skrjabini miyazakii]|uniref:Uncharacterized protein n=1 Tax=Paragonimus skrjabini miyazakii TaxID=59628 RepID=A0A8S9YGU4_9TREM|nr:hypothetical protein EG68_12605 [Paragonimus skrjabini miyazakii]
MRKLGSIFSRPTCGNHPSLRMLILVTLPRLLKVSLEPILRRFVSVPVSRLVVNRSKLRYELSENDKHNQMQWRMKAILCLKLLVVTLTKPCVSPGGRRQKTTCASMKCSLRRCSNLEGLVAISDSRAIQLVVQRPDREDQVRCLLQ